MNFNLYKHQFDNFKDLSLRPQQQQALEFIEQSTKPIIVISGPCGIGKSLLGFIVLAMHDGGIYNVQSKQLQSQLRHDFPEAQCMLGRNNFACIANTDLNCDDCTHTKRSPCSDKYDCYYEMKKRAVLKAKYKILNYAYWIHEVNYIGRFSTPDGVVICDEADVLEGVLSNFINLHVPAYILSKTNMKLPSKITPGAADAINIWKSWAERLKDRLKYQIVKLDQLIQKEENTISGKPAPLLKNRKNIVGIIDRVNIFTQNVNKQWILEVEKSKFKGGAPSVTFKPVWISDDLAHEYLWKHGSKFILMSATFPPKQVLSKTLGRPVGDFDYLSLPSSFPIENRKVWSLGAAKLINKKDKDGIPIIDKELPKALDAIDHILIKGYKDYPILDKKGIIHTWTWKLNKAVVEDDKSGRVITHNSNNKDEVLERFYNSKKPLVLASPSITRGVDLKYDLCRFIIWLKCPFLHLGDKLTSARVYGKDPTGGIWYSSMCAQEIMQGCGRGMRAIDDWCVNILLDRKIQQLIVDSKTNKYFAKYWLESFDIDLEGLK